MRKIFSFVLLLTLSGCATVDVPKYIQDKNPYKKIFYASFDETLSAAKKTLEHYGWTILNDYDPTVFEQNKELGTPEAKQILLFTEDRQTPFFLGSSYSRINAYVRTVDKTSTEVELRYVTVASVPFKTFNTYKNDRVIHHIFDAIGAAVK